MEWTGDSTVPVTGTTERDEASEAGGGQLVWVLVHHTKGLQVVVKEPSPEKSQWKFPEKEELKPC